MDEKIRRFNWNFPQQLTNWYKMDEIKQMIAQIYEHIAKLEAEIAELKNK